MNTDKANQLRTRFVVLRNQLQNAKPILHSEASAGQSGDAEQSFHESRVLEAKSEVDSGEFDVHG